MVKVEKVQKIKKEGYVLAEKGQMVKQKSRKKSSKPPKEKKTRRKKEPIEEAYDVIDKIGKKKPRGQRTVYKEVGFLPGDLYSRKKNEIKKVLKKYGMVFDRNKYGIGLFLWSNGTETMMGDFKKDTMGVTLRAGLIWNSDVRTDFQRELETLVVSLGGRWMTFAEYDKMLEGGLHGFDKEWIDRLFAEEKNAK